MQGVKNAPRGLLLSGRSEVQILLATPKTPPKTLICARHEPSGNACISFGDARVSEKLVSHVQGFRRFLFSEKNRTHSNVQLARANSANQPKLENNRSSPPDFSHKKSAADLATPCLTSVIKLFSRSFSS